MSDKSPVEKTVRLMKSPPQWLHAKLVNHNTRGLLLATSICLVFLWLRISIVDEVKFINELIKPPRYGSPDESPGHATYKPDPWHDVIVHNAAVACDVPMCSTMAVDILRRGGSAVDAAVTTALCIGSYNSFSSGIGGGGFMTIRHQNGSSIAINFREKAPQFASKHMFDDNNILAQIGGLASGVPGELAGLDEAFKRYTSGVLSWSEVIEPVIKLNRQGFIVNEILERSLIASERDFLKYDKDWDFYLIHNNNKEVAKQGDLVKREKFAHTLELIALNGSSAIFYDPNGPIVPSLVEANQYRGGILTEHDFSQYSAEVTDTIKTEFMGKEVLTTPNPSSGPVLLLGLNILNSLLEVGTNDTDPVATQRIVETMKWMAAGRTELGDVRSNSDRVEEIMSLEWAEQCRQNMSDTHTFPWEHYRPSYEQTDPHGTTHFAVIDKHGMAVSMTTTVNLGFGSKIVDPVTGVIFNSQMDDFSIPHVSNAFHLQPSIYNYVTPFKRPLSSTAPTIISNKLTGKPELIIGSAGGSRIPTAILQAIVRVLTFKLPLLETIAYPRMHHQLIPEDAYFEDGVLQSIVDDLESRDHKVLVNGPATAMNGIYIDPHTGVIHAVCDWWRKLGRADGY